MSSGGRGPDLGGVGLGPGDQVLAHLVGGLAGLLDDPAGLVAGVGELSLVVLELVLGLGPHRLGVLEVAADLVLAVLRAPS